MTKRYWPAHAAVYVAAYVAWLLLLVLGLWILVVAREAFTGLAARYVGDSLSRGWQAGFVDKVLVVLAGLAWLAFMVLTEEYFREGAKRRVLRWRLGRVAGAEILLLFLTDLSLALLRGFGGWLRILILAAELAAGLGLTLLTGPRRARRPGATSPLRN
jgi:hypothetical protein